MVELSIIRELSYVRVPQLGKITQCTASLSSTNMRKRLCECINFSHVHTECGTNISNGMSPDHRYIKLATGFDYADVSPVSGVRFGDGGEQVSTSIIFEQQ